MQDTWEPQRIVGSSQANSVARLRFTEMSQVCPSEQDRIGQEERRTAMRNRRPDAERDPARTSTAQEAPCWFFATYRMCDRKPPLTAIEDQPRAEITGGKWNSRCTAGQSAAVLSANGWTSSPRAEPCPMSGRKRTSRTSGPQSSQA